MVPRPGGGPLPSPLCVGGTLGIGACDNLSNPDRSLKSLRGDTEPEPEQGEPLSLKGRATVGGNGVGLEQAGSVRPVQRTPFPETGLDLLRFLSGAKEFVELQNQSPI